MLSPKPQQVSECRSSTTHPLYDNDTTSERRSNTICAVVEWPDHHCGDDLVSFASVCHTLTVLVFNYINKPKTLLDFSLTAANLMFVMFEL